MGDCAQPVWRAWWPLDTAAAPARQCAPTLMTAVVGVWAVAAAAAATAATIVRAAAAMVIGS